MKNPSILQELLKDSSVLDSVVNNPKYSSRLYGVALPKDVLNKLEGTGDEYYYLNRNDNRTEAQLMVVFEEYFSNPLFDEYEIVKNVDPTYVGAHPKCKPIQFLFKKDGKDVLAVAILKHSSTSHMAITDVKYSCYDKNIKYIRFIVGYPNKEHYVVISKDKKNISSISQLNNKKIGVLSADEKTINKYLGTTGNTIINKYETSTNLFQALEANTDIEYAKKLGLAIKLLATSKKIGDLFGPPISI